MKKRILTHNLWEHTIGESINGDFIDTKYLTFKGDTMMFNYGEHRGIDTLVLRYQYFSTMKVMDPKTKKTGKYAMKGGSWFDYLFK